MPFSLFRNLKYLLVFNTFIITYSTSASVCEHKNLSSLATANDGTSSIEKFQTPQRDIVVSFTSHYGSAEQDTMAGLKGYFLGNLRPRDIDDVTEHLKRRLEDNKVHLTEMRRDISKITELHKKRPFQYVALEASKENIQRHKMEVENMEWIVGVLKNKFSHKLTEQEIDNIALLLLGDEGYLLMKGNPLSKLPIVYSERKGWEKRFDNNRNDCRYGLAGLRSLKNRESAQFYVSTIEDDEKVGKMTPQQYEKFEDNMFRLIQSDPSLKGFGLRKVIEKKQIQNALKACRTINNSERDHEFVKIITREVPSGRGLAFRGNAHRMPVTRIFKAHCQSRSSSKKSSKSVGGHIETR